MESNSFYLPWMTAEVDSDLRALGHDENTCLAYPVGTGGEVAGQHAKLTKETFCLTLRPDVGDKIQEQAYRFAGIIMSGHGRSALLSLILLVPLSLEAAMGQDEAAEDSFTERARAEAETYEFSLDDADSTPLELETVPLLKWTNPVTGSMKLKSRR